MKRLVSLCSLLPVLALALLQGCGNSKASASLPPPVEISIEGESPTEAEDRSVKRAAGNLFEKPGDTRPPIPFQARLSYHAAIEGNTLRFYRVEFIEIKCGGNIFQRDRKVLLTDQSLDLTHCQPRNRYAVRIKCKGKFSETALSEEIMTAAGFAFEASSYSGEETPRRPSMREEPHLIQIGARGNERIVSEWVFTEPDASAEASTPTVYAKLKSGQWDVCIFEIPPDGALHNDTSTETEPAGLKINNKGRWSQPGSNSGGSH